ncbi:unnamed protein product [Pylaiella littoralis]
MESERSELVKGSVQPTLESLCRHLCCWYVAEAGKACKAVAFEERLFEGVRRACDTSGAAVQGCHGWAEKQGTSVWR